MEDMHFFTNKSLMKYLSTLDQFPAKMQGTEGIIYRQDDQVIKHFFHDAEVDLSKIDQFRNIQIRDFYFIEALIYVRRKVKAAISTYAPGEDLYDRVTVRISIDLLLKAFTRLLEDIDSLSSEGIRVFDINPGNILFDQDHFNFIDTARYYRSSVKQDSLKYLNMNAIMKTIYYYTLPEYIYRYFKQHEFLDNIGTQDPRVRLERLKRFLERVLGESITSFGQANDIMRLHKIKLQ